MVHRLGQRAAEFHAALARDPFDPAFAPEPFDQMYARSIFQTMQTERQRVFGQLREARARVPATVRPLIEQLLPQEPEVDRRFRRLLERRFTGQRIRIHGDYHLGQVLWTGKDFVIIDLEGEPIRSVSERQLRRSALRDVAGMLRSFDYAARAALEEIPIAHTPAAGGAAELQPLADLWVAGCSAEFLRGYRGSPVAADFLPKDPAEFRALLEAYLLEKGLYEVEYELTNRPGWLAVPLRGLAHLLQPPG